MVKCKKTASGKWTLPGLNLSCDKCVGSRAQVWQGTACKTAGGLTKKNLKMNKRGRIVSAKKAASAKRLKRLEKAGYFTKKGKFGAVFKGDKKTKNKRGKRKGKK